MTTTNNRTFEAGDLYVFSSSTQDEPIWGIFDSFDNTGNIRLEVASSDFNHFSRQITLPAECRHTRPATRDELRDFAYNMGCQHI